MAAGSRPARVGEALKEALAERLLRKVKDPRVALVPLLTVTRVDVSPDLRHARVHCSIIGDADAKRAAIRGLESAAGFLRVACARELHTKVSPELTFLLDEGADHVERIESVLREIHEHEGRSGDHAPSEADAGNETDGHDTDDETDETAGNDTDDHDTDGEGSSGNG
jgi:ribosome-binding factor A